MLNYRPDWQTHKVRRREIVKVNEHSPAKTDFWDKVWWLWSLILYATLLFAAVDVWFDARYTAAQKGQMVVLTVVFASWNGAFVYYIRSHASDFNLERDRYLVPALVYLSGADRAVVCACFTVSRF